MRDHGPPTGTPVVTDSRPYRNGPITDVPAPSPTYSRSKSVPQAPPLAISGTGFSPEAFDLLLIFSAVVQTPRIPTKPGQTKGRHPWSLWDGATFDFSK
jgi:hypothetical protein